MLLMPAMSELTDRQSRFFFLFQSLTIRQPVDPLRPLLDSDVADATGSLAKTLETASRGVIYEQSPASLPAQELLAALRRAFEEIVREMQGPRSPLERDAARALRSIEEAARRIGPIVGNPRGGFLELARRVLKPPPGASDRPESPEGGAQGAGTIILP
jgi:hypothetical protein